MEDETDECEYITPTWVAYEWRRLLREIDEPATDWFSYRVALAIDHFFGLRVWFPQLLLLVPPSWGYHLNPRVCEVTAWVYSTVVASFCDRAGMFSYAQELAIWHETAQEPVSDSEWEPPESLADEEAGESESSLSPSEYESEVSEWEHGDGEPAAKRHCG